MRLATPTHHHIHMPQIHLSAGTRQWLHAVCSAALPYLVAALVLFAYHEQWFR